MLVEKRKRIISYYRKLCVELNENDFRLEAHLDGKLCPIEYEVDENHPDLTMTTITRDRDAYFFLKNSDLLRSDMCQFCGELFVDDSYKLSEPVNKISLNICQNCALDRKSANQSDESECSFPF
jgi:hypothetical protein